LHVTGDPHAAADRALPEVLLVRRGSDVLPGVAVPPDPPEHDGGVGVGNLLEGGRVDLAAVPVGELLAGGEGLAVGLQPQPGVLDELRERLDRRLEVEFTRVVGDRGTGDEGGDHLVAPLSLHEHDAGVLLRHQLVPSQEDAVAEVRAALPLVTHLGLAGTHRHLDQVTVGLPVAVVAQVGSDQALR
jgi:hypothetical protein